MLLIDSIDSAASNIRRVRLTRNGVEGTVSILVRVCLLECVCVRVCVCV